MKKFILALMFLFVGSTIVMAHPGRTASDGCHYCRTRCDYWGVPWNERHCHGNNYQDTIIIDSLVNNLVNQENILDPNHNHENDHIHKDVIPHFFQKLSPDNAQNCTDG